jgi:diacylglycerol kinase family enzyme
MRHPQDSSAARTTRLVTVIANGTAGQGCTREWARGVEETFRGHGLQATVRLVHDGEEIMRVTDDALAQQAELIVAAGGDGTVSAVASRVANTRTAIGVMPMGTLNHFAKDLGIPLEPEAAIASIANGREASVDIGEVNGRTFINNSSLGLYPDIVRDRERQRRRLGRGKWAALLAASLNAARRYPVLELRIDLDGQTLTRRSAFIFIGNNEYTMEGFEIGERERVDRGLLTLYVTQRMGRFGLLRLALRALVRRLRQARDFDMLTATSLVVDTPDHHLRVATDGEVTLMETPLHYRIRPGALRVIVPAAQGEQR